jgi:hypothetical protein
MSAVAAPDRSLAQRFTALERANEIRIGRAALKDDIRALSYEDARHRVADLILRPPTFLLTMRVEELMLAMPRFGDVKVHKVMWAQQISPRKRIGGMTLRQREALSNVLRVREWVKGR